MHGNGLVRWRSEVLRQVNESYVRWWMNALGQDVDPFRIGVVAAEPFELQDNHRFVVRFAKHLVQRVCVLVTDPCRHYIQVTGRHLHYLALEIRGLRFSGLAAWMLWRGVYLAKLPGLEKKLRVVIDWTIDLLFPRDIVLAAEPNDQPAPVPVGTDAGGQR